MVRINVVIQIPRDYFQTKTRLLYRVTDEGVAAELYALQKNHKVVAIFVNAFDCDDNCYRINPKKLVCSPGVYPNNLSIVTPHSG